MPIFEYQCRGCGTCFERLVMSAGASVSCPTCESSEVVKQFSTFSTQTAAGFSGSLGPGCACAPSG
ncbi:MAG: zinc ribbon domain-containing protein [Candidatus Methylomirabilales bacterium]